VTKELYFDTHVPEEFLDKAPFDFPFKVTLEPPPAGYHFEYAGPVGYIRFYPELEDFGYDTDYTRKGDPAMHERMKVIQAELDGAVATTAPLSPIAAPSLPQPAPSVPEEVVEENDSLVKAEATAAPLVHRTGEGSMSSEIPRQLQPRNTAREHKPVVRPLTAQPVVHGPPAHFSAIARAPVVREESPMPSGRTEELITEKTRVTTIVRITEQGHMTEWRRVAHAFGPVFYFKDGVSCSDREYREGTGAGSP
jgi:hypothetical protein